MLGLGFQLFLLFGVAIEIGAVGLGDGLAAGDQQFILVGDGEGLGLLGLIFVPLVRAADLDDVGLVSMVGGHQCGHRRKGGEERAAEGGPGDPLLGGVVGVVV